MHRIVLMLENCGGACWRGERGGLNSAVSSPATVLGLKVNTKRAKRGSDQVCKGALSRTVVDGIEHCTIKALFILFNTYFTSVVPTATALLCHHRNQSVL